MDGDAVASANGINACPYAFGFIPQELICRLRIGLDGRPGVSWWRRLWRMFTGYYDCPCEGLLPCDRFRDATDEAS